MKTKSIFITATGTDIGKTYISALLVKTMRKYKFNCGYYKPVLSGAETDNNGNIVPGDVKFVLENAEINSTNFKNYLSYCFTDPISPHLAAERANTSISIEKIKKDYTKLSKQFEYMVVEGAGGITCPLATKDKILLLPEVIKSLDSGIIIVADAGLGTINSTLLTVEYAKQHNIKILGIILNNFEKENYMHKDNKLQIEKLTKVEVITTVKNAQQNIDITKDKLITLFNK